ncbi:MAG: hypothetical protein WEA34_09095 [Gemmatimonadota bacterium]
MSRLFDFARPRRYPIRFALPHRLRPAIGSLIATTLVLLSTPTGSTAQSPEGAVLPTDSVIGTVVQRFAGGFLLRADDGEEYAFEIAPDSVDQRQDVDPDSVDRRVPHASVMDERDIRFVLRQLEASDERDRIHVHYVTVGEADPRRIAIWVSIDEDRVPGG